MARAMLPGTYLEKRRLMAGYSLSSLARELLMLTGFGSGRMGGARLESDFRRLRLTLISAEQGSIPHSPERIELIRNFVPLDPDVYFRLLSHDRREVRLCPNCACSFHDPCLLPAAHGAPLGTSVCQPTEGALCSACATLTERAAPPAPLRAASIADQLRELGDRIQRLANSDEARSAASGIETLATALSSSSAAVGHQNDQPPFLRLVPNPGEQ